MPALRIVVLGRVQGVGFRNFVLLHARSLDLCGEVWNRSDGGLEVVAEHESREVLDVFAEGLQGGPGFVRDVQIESTIERGYANFSVGVTR